MSIDTGGPAFPLNGGIEQLECKFPVQGMTMRDYFAAKAMQGILSDRSWQGNTCGTTAAIAYEVADSMLKARQ